MPSHYVKISNMLRPLEAAFAIDKREKNGFMPFLAPLDVD
jgi:hypothetical protein